MENSKKDKNYQLKSNHCTTFRCHINCIFYFSFTKVWKIMTCLPLVLTFSHPADQIFAFSLRFTLIYIHIQIFCTSFCSGLSVAHWISTPLFLTNIMVLHHRFEIGSLNVHNDPRATSLLQLINRFCSI